jgi:hypothetical protein
MCPRDDFLDNPDLALLSTRYDYHTVIFLDVKVLFLVHHKRIF